MKSSIKTSLLHLLALALFASSCATTREYNSKLPIEVDQGTIENSYKQEGQILNPIKLHKELKSDPSIYREAKLSEVYYYSSIVMGVLSGACLGAATAKVLNKNETAEVEGIVGIAGLGLTFLFLKQSEYYLESAIDLHNHTLSKNTKEPQKSSFLSTPRVYPLLSQDTVGAALQFRFTL
jgi:hypothetical protein